MFFLDNFSSITEYFFSRSYIAGTNGYSNGIVPMLRAYDATARYVDQGGSKLLERLQSTLKPGMLIFSNSRISGRTTERGSSCSRSLFTLFGFLTFCTLLLCNFNRILNNFSSMKRVEANGEWSLFCPNEAPGLFIARSLKLCIRNTRRERRARKTVPAQKLWYAVLESQIETGGPFMVYKDHVNRKFDGTSSTSFITHSLFR